MSTDPSTPPYQPPPTGPIAMPVQQTNPAGLAGFIISLCGFITCVCFPIGLIVSLVGLKSEPKGLAIAGTVIGAIGTVLVVIIIAVYGVAITACIGTCIGIGAATQQTIMQQVETDDAINEAKLLIDNFEAENNRLPDETEGNDLIGDLTDGWENALRYEPLDGDYEIRSAGSDGEFDTEDDRTTEDVFSFDVDDYDSDVDDYDSGVDDYDSGVDATPDDSSDVSGDVPEDPDDAPEDPDDAPEDSDDL